jgi:hypothetical protein
MNTDIRYQNTAFSAYECAKMTLEEFGNTFAWIFAGNEADIAVVYQQCLDLVASNTPPEPKPKAQKVKPQIPDPEPQPVIQTGGEEDSATVIQS